MPFVKNDVIEAEVLDFGSEGEGIIKVGGVPLFIRGAIPGESIRAKVIGIKASHGFALLEQVLVPSKDRVKPPCPYASKCGGCALQHIKYARQLELKRAHVLNTVKKTAGIELPLPAVIPSETELHCRNKLSLPVRSRPDAVAEFSKTSAVAPLAIGFFRRKSHDVIDIADCLLQKDSCRDLISGLKAFMEKHRLSGYSETDNSGDIRHITLRSLGGVYTVTLVGTRKEATAFLPFQEILKNIYGEKFSYYYNYNPVANNVIYGEKFAFLAGIGDPILLDGLKMRPHPAGFFQVNDPIREKMYAYILETAAKHGAEYGGNKKNRAVEAYAGAGILAAKLAPFFKNATAIEISAESVASGEEIKKLNGIQNLKFIKGDCSEELKKYFGGQKTLQAQAGAAKPVKKQAGQNTEENSPSEKTADFLVLDPPRQGLEITVTETLNACGPKTVLYVSCNPATLGRDLGLLKENYKVQDAAAFDMFPQTPNVETLVCLERKN